MHLLSDEGDIGKKSRRQEEEETGLSNSAVVAVSHGLKRGAGCCSFKSHMKDVGSLPRSSFVGPLGLSWLPIQPPYHFWYSGTASFSTGAVPC